MKEDVHYYVIFSWIVIGTLWMPKTINPYLIPEKNPFFKNCVDPDQLASEKQADQDPHCFLLCKILPELEC